MSETNSIIQLLLSRKYTIKEPSIKDVKSGDFDPYIIIYHRDDFEFHINLYNNTFSLFSEGDLIVSDIGIVTSEYLKYGENMERGHWGNITCDIRDALISAERGGLLIVYFNISITFSLHSFVKPYPSK